MPLISRHGLLAKILVITLVAALELFKATPSFSTEGRDILWSIVSGCMNTGAADYCTSCVSPREEAGCGHSCRNSTQVWAESREFVAIRDRKMCSCPTGFVHGLALPRVRLTGVEDPARPDGIWEFAWDAAARRIPEREIALAVNPWGKRSQDQLHVHIVRLRSGSRLADPSRTARVDALGKVWATAAAKAAALGWRDYGVLVTRGTGEGYLVIVDDDSPEYDYTQATCLNDAHPP